MRHHIPVSRSIAVLLVAVAAGCGGAPPAPAPPPANPLVPGGLVAASDGDAGAPVESETEAEPKRQRPPIEVINLCHDVALLAYGEPPNFKSDSLGRFMGDASGSAPRERDGSLPVALVDEKGNVLAKVLVTKRMKKLEIGRSCRTLYAH